MAKRVVEVGDEMVVEVVFEEKVKMMLEMGIQMLPAVLFVMEMGM